jgi:outer membrane protein assembly factor BamB
MPLLFCLPFGLPCLYNPTRFFPDKTAFEMPPMNTPAFYQCLLFFLLFSCSQPATGQEWTRFRGPNGSGESEATTIPATWTTQDYSWRVKLPGIGYSSPVASGNRIFVTCGIEEDATRIIRCLDRFDGSLIWKRSFESAPHHLNKLNSYAVGTPTVDRDQVYMSWATPQEYIVLALDQQKGRQIWRRDLGPFQSQHGFGSSPILFDDMVIVANDQLGESFTMALDCTTGETRWKAPRRSVRAAYSTGCIYQPAGGSPQLILTSTAHGVTALDPRTGKTVWELDGVLPQRVVGSPVVVQGLILAYCGTGGRGTRMIAVRPGDPGRGIEAKIAWEIKGSLPYVCTPVAYGDLLFLWYDQGVVTCVDAPSGKIHWRQRVGGSYFGSPVRVADRIYCISRDGEMVVLAAADHYQVLARIDLEERSNSTPVVADGVMYLRTASHLMAIDGKASEGGGQSPDEGLSRR